MSHTHRPDCLWDLYLIVLRTTNIIVVLVELGLEAANMRPPLFSIRSQQVDRYSLTMNTSTMFFYFLTRLRPCVEPGTPAVEKS